MLGLHFTLACVLLLVCSLHFTQSAFYPWSAVCSPQSAVFVLHWPTTKIRNFTYVVVYQKCYKFLIFQLHLKKLSSPLPAFRTFYHLPFSLQKNFNWPAKILLYPFLSPSSCGIHIECSLIRTQIYFSKPLNGWFTKYFPYISWSWCIRIRRSLISNDNITKVNRALWLVS